MLKIYPILAVLIILLLGIFGVYQDKSRVMNAQSTTAENPSFENRIEEAGPEKAYEEFKIAYADKPFNIQHPMAHTMGRLLYKKLGIKGFSICDETFAFGCYHSFFEGVFNDHGIGVIGDLNEACIKKFGEMGTGCQHGIGHGIMAYLGRDKLSEALNYCQLTNQKHPLHGCTAGVFMEYNISSHFTDGKLDVRELNPQNSHDPCDGLPVENYRKSCYFEIGLWWKEVISKDFAKLGTLCQEITDLDERDVCFQGLGTIVAPSTDYDVTKTLTICKSMPDAFGEDACRKAAYGVFSNNPKHKEKAKDIMLQY